VVVFLTVALFPIAATAQIKTGAHLSARMQQRTSIARSGTPVSLVWDLKWTGLEILEGYLDIIVYDGREKLAQLATDEIVVTTGERRIETRLPVISTDNSFRQAELHASLVTPKRSYDLGTFPLRLRPYGTRRFAVGVSDPWETGYSTRQRQIVFSLRFERFNPDPKDLSVRTSLDNIRPSEMPSDALGYCGFNLVVLMDEGFADLRANQLDALYEWVAAGGSVCVLPGGGLDNDHLNFLAKLAARNPDAAPFVPDAEGRLIPDGPSGEAAIRLFAPGIGRAAVVMTAEDSQRQLDSQEWREMVAHLWSVRRQVIPRLVADSNWEHVNIVSYSEMMGNSRGAVQDKFDYKPISQGNWLLERLMPETVKVVPLGLIALILAGYVLLIGPGDYFLLGLLKLRKLTWLLFPLVTVAVTLFTVALSNWYMQPSEDRRTVQFLDIGDDDAVARESKFELLFFSRPREVETQVTGETFAAFNQQRFSMQAQQQYMQYGYRGEVAPEQLVGVAGYSGRIPGNYTVTQNIPQWTPQINRRFAIAPSTDSSDATVPRFDWDSLRPSVAGNMADAVRQQSWQAKVRRQVSRHFGNQAAVWVMSGSNVQQIAGSHGLFVRRHTPTQYDAFYPDYGQAGQYQQGDFLTQTCIRAPYGLYSLVSRIAPTGGDTFEDLPILDPSDERQCLLVVAVEDEGHLRIYRRLYVKQ
jgi:hypothetical protein